MSDGLNDGELPRRNNQWMLEHLIPVFHAYDGGQLSKEAFLYLLNELKVKAPCRGAFLEASPKRQIEWLILKTKDAML